MPINKSVAVPEKITLPLGATADLHKCGSCYYFQRVPDAESRPSRGTCSLTLPPQFMKHPFSSDSGDPADLNDYDGCSLWKASGARYVVSYVVNTEKGAQ